MTSAARFALSALPFALPRSALPDNVWPALPDAAASRVLALEFQLQQSQWWPPEVIEARQFEQLQHVLAHAQLTVPFYRQRPAAIDLRAPLDRERWMRIPILSRQALQLNKDALLSRAVPAQHGAVGEVSSSGSTGRPFTIHATDYVSLMGHVFTLREHFWHRRNLAGKLCAIRHQDGESALPPAGGRLPGWGPATDVAYRTGACAVLHIRASVSEQAQWLLREAPDYLLTYPTSARELIRFFRDRGLKLPRPLELRTVSEALPADLRALAREVWNAKVVDMYSARETGYIALQCPEFEHYHVQSENLLVEILDDAGRPCRPGEVGRVVLTTLHNFATPLIRYDIGDYAEVGGPCRCGRGLPVLTRIMGRVRNMLALPNGERQWPSLRFDVVHEIAPILQLQVAQTGPNRLEVRLVVARALTAAEEAAVAEHLCNSLRHRFDIAFRYVGEIPRGPTGKFEEFVSELDA
jgi:phenylacetate-CoA ligase